MPDAGGRAGASLAAVEVHRLRTERTARLVQVGRLAADTEAVVIACHGYGMDVERFAAKFEDGPAGTCALCPEGLSRFYWGGFDGRPVASWMTRAERLHEIDDFCGWLDDVLVLAKAQAPKARVYGFGFSQGAATVMRWADKSRPSLKGVILWSGTPPEDIAYEPRAYFERMTRVAYWGDGDKLVPWARARERFAAVPLSFEHRRFAGGHRVVREAVHALLEGLVLRSADRRTDTPP